MSTSVMLPCAVEGVNASVPAKTFRESRGLTYQLSQLLRRSHPALSKLADDASDETEIEVTLAVPLDRASPYVGFCRHAPSSLGGNADSPRHFSLDWDRLISQDEQQVPSLTFDDSGAQCFGALPGSIPTELWQFVLSWAIEIRTIATLAAVSRAFHELPRSHAVWSGRAVRIAPLALKGLLPRLHSWVPHWRDADKLVVPRSTQLAAELSRQCPHTPVEVAWRFAEHLSGNGVEVLNCGLAVRRVGDEGLVVLGDAPLLGNFFEVRLDERSHDDADDDFPNDFGIGVTTCDPGQMGDDLADVADDVPQSLVVDFARSFVALSCENREVARSGTLCAADLSEGDRVGLQIKPEGIHVFVNGRLRATLTPEAPGRVPEGVPFFPVLDLYGKAVRISLSEADSPRP